MSGEKCGINSTPLKDIVSDEDYQEISEILEGMKKTKDSTENTLKEDNKEEK